MSSENVAEPDFWEVIGRLFQDGIGHTAKPWTRSAFGARIGEALYGKEKANKFQTSTLDGWLDNRQLPRKDQFNAICDACFSPGAPRARRTRDPEAEEAELRSAWHAEQDRRRRQRRPSARELPSRGEPRCEPEAETNVADGDMSTLLPAFVPPGDTSLELAVRNIGHDIGGMVEFTLDPPRSWQDPPNSCAIYATLAFAEKHHQQTGATVSLARAFVGIAGDGFQVPNGTRIGWAQRPHDHFEFALRGSKVTGPVAGGHLSGEALPDGEHLAVIYPISDSARDVVVRVTAAQSEINLTLARSPDEMSAKERVNKLSIMKALLGKHFGVDEEDRIILAERRLARIVAPK